MEMTKMLPLLQEKFGDVETLLQKEKFSMADYSGTHHKYAFDATDCEKCTGAMFGDDECERCKGAMFG